MVGYGGEDNHFVVELTYNYGIGSYALGNDFQVCVTFGLSARLNGHDKVAITMSFESSYVAY